jgi:branched-chain amino acid transport system substrate-binding protein
MKTVKLQICAIAGITAVLAACSSSHPTSPAPRATPKPSSTTAASGGFPAAVSNEYALAYTGSSGGRAKGSPIVIGWVNMQGGVPAFPEATAGTEAALDYVNDELGGVDGHPLELHSCYVQTEEDGQRCGLQMLNDPAVHVVLTGTLAVGSQSLYSALAGHKPVLIGNPVVGPDFATKAGFSYQSGAPGVIVGLAQFIKKYLSGTKSVAVIADNDPSGEAAANQLFVPAMKQAGIAAKAVFVPDSATAGQTASALEAAGGQTADVVVALVQVQGCVALYDALQSLGVKPKVVTSGLCYGTPVIQALHGSLPNGWYFGGYGFSPFIPGTSSVPGSLAETTYYVKIHQYGGANVDYTGFAGAAFGDIMTLSKLMNQLGVEHLTATNLGVAIKGFRGPQWGVAGPMACGANPAFPALCGAAVGVQQYVGGRWVSIADAYNGKVINAFGG